MVIFHSYVSLPEGISFLSNTSSFWCTEKFVETAWCCSGAGEKKRSGALAAASFAEHQFWWIVWEHIYGFWFCLPDLATFIMFAARQIRSVSIWENPVGAGPTCWTTCELSSIRTSKVIGSSLQDATPEIEPMWPGILCSLYRGSIILYCKIWQTITILGLVWFRYVQFWRVSLDLLPPVNEILCGSSSDGKPCRQSAAAALFTTCSPNMFSTVFPYFWWLTSCTAHIGSHRLTSLSHGGRNVPFCSQGAWCKTHLRGEAKRSPGGEENGIWFMFLTFGSWRQFTTVCTSYIWLYYVYNTYTCGIRIYIYYTVYYMIYI